MLNSIIRKELSQWLLMAIAFTIPFPILLNNIIIICALAYLVFRGGFLPSFVAVIKHKQAYLLGLYFAFHIFSIFFSQDQNEAFHHLERKLVLLIFPLLLIHPSSENQFMRIGFAFISGVVLAILFCLIKSLWVFTQTSDPSVFYYHSLSNQIGIHAIYLSCYAVFSIFFLLFYIERISFHNWTIGLVLMILIASTILLSSKLMLIVLFLGSIYIVKAKGLISKKIGLGLLFLMVGSILFFSINSAVVHRYLLEFDSNFGVINQETYKYDTPFTGTTLRLTIWKHCLNILSSQNAFLLGVGTGDVQSLLDKAYLTSGMYTGNPSLGDTGYLGYGPHNQYMDTFMAFGILGLLFFLIMLFNQLLYSLNNGNPLFILFMLMILLFMVTESVLNTNKGLVFYTFFFLCFYSYSNRVQNE